MISNKTREYMPFDLPPVATVSGQRPANRVAATDVEGAFKSRRGYTLDPGSTCEVTWEMEGYEFGIFHNWWEGQLVRGLKWFWMQLPSPEGLEGWSLVRFVTPYEMVPTGWDENRVTATLELRDRYVRKTRPYSVPEPFVAGTLDEDPLWEFVAFAAPYDTDLDDVKFGWTPETIQGTAELASGVGDEPSTHLYVQGDEAFVDYGWQEEFDLRGDAGGDVEEWCIECLFQNRGGEKDSVLWIMNTTSGEPEQDPYASSYGLAVRRGQLYFFADDGVSQRKFEVVLDDVVLPADAWYHCFAQVRKGLIELGIAPLGATNGTVTVMAPQLFNFPIQPRFVVGADVSEFQYEFMRYFTGKVDDLRITSVVRYA